MKGKVLLAGICAMAVSACATPETRLKTALSDIGLPHPVAACMAGDMVDRLSLAQLNRLASLKKLEGKKATEISIDEFVRRTRALRDSKILAVTSSAALICAIKS